MQLSFRKALVLAPHPDDGELGCGGTIAKLVESGCEVFYAGFSDCRESVPPQFPQDILLTEVKAATKVLGVKPEHLIMFDYRVRTYSDNRQDILENMVKLKKQINPDLVLIPSLNDIHQDHTTIAHEAVRAFKMSTILSYELLWNNFNFHTACFVALTGAHMDIKVNAMAQYASQKHRPYAGAEFLKGLGKARGVQSGNEYAETFEVVRINM